VSYINLTEQQILKYYYDNIQELDSSLVFISEQGKAIYSAMIKIAEQDNKIEIPLIYKYAILNYPKLKESELEFFNSFSYEHDNIDQYKNDLYKLIVQEAIQDGVLSEFTIAISKKQIDTEELRGLYDQLGEKLDTLDKTEEAEKVWAEIDEYIDYEGVLKDRLKGRRLSSGCSLLDTHLYNGSLYPGEITTILGFTGSGKSTFKNALVEKRRIQGLPTIDINLEMSETATLDSKMALRFRKPKALFHLTDEDYKDDQYEYIISEMEKRYPRAKRNKSYVSYNTTSLSIYKLKKKILVFKRKMGLKKLDYACVFIDLITQIKEFNQGTGNKADWYEHAMESLLSLSKELNIHIVGVVQQKRINDRIRIREVDDVEIFRPTVETIKNGHAIAERSRCVLAIFRKKHFVKEYLPNDPELEVMDDIMECQIIKQNMGDISPIFKYLFNGATGEIYKYIEDEYETE
jgi:hypothetical protein